MREERKFLRVHSGRSLLGSDQFGRKITALVADSSECFNIGDAYREGRFDGIDFPSVVRSLVCLPIRRGGVSIGALLFSHSQPQFFNDNHLRVLKILATTIGHLRLLTSSRCEPSSGPVVRPAETDDPELLSIAILEFEAVDPFGRAIALEREALRTLRGLLRGALDSGDSILFHGAGALLVLMPKTSSEAVPRRVRALRLVFEDWRTLQNGALRSTRISFGYATCEDGDDLGRTLEMASFLMHPEVDQLGMTDR